MGRKAKVIELSLTARAELGKGYKSRSEAIYSRRCHILLLKSEGRSSKAIAAIFGITDQAVNNWVKRYESEGIRGL